MQMAKKLKVTLVRSLSGRIQSHRDTIHALGIRKVNHSVIHKDSPQIRGMIRAVRHLVEVEEVN